MAFGQRNHPDANQRFAQKLDSYLCRTNLLARVARTCNTCTCSGMGCKSLICTGCTFGDKKICIRVARREQSVDLYPMPVQIFGTKGTNQALLASICSGKGKRTQCRTNRRFVPPKGGKKGASRGCKSTICTCYIANKSKICPP